jgi:hypothetical protein
LAGLERAASCYAAGGLVRADLFASGTPLAFVHPLVRLAVYETIDMASESERTRGQEPRKSSVFG